MADGTGIPTGRVGSCHIHLASRFIVGLFYCVYPNAFVDTNSWFEIADASGKLDVEPY